MTQRKLYAASFGAYLYEDTDLIDDSDGDFPGMTMAGGATDGPIIAALLELLDTNHSNHLSLVWNENDTVNRILNLIVGAGNRSLTIFADFRVPTNQILPISTGVITVNSPGKKTIQAETGVTDDLTRINGLNEGEFAILMADSGDTITITAGANLKMPSPTFTLSGYRTITFDCIGSDICVMRSSSANRT